MVRINTLPVAILFCLLLAFIGLPAQEQRYAHAAASGGTDLFDTQTLYLPFEGSALDASGKGNHGTSSAALGYPEGVIGSQSADLANGYIALNASKFKFGSAQNYSVSFWMKADGSLMNDTTIISNKDWASGANLGWEIGMERSKLTVNYKGASANRVDLSKTFTVGDDQWHHIAVSYDRAGKANVYVDNALKGSLTIAGSGTIDTTLNLNIGADGKQNLPYTGKLDDFRIFSKALTANEVKTLYQLSPNLSGADAPVWPAGAKLDGGRYGLNGYRFSWNGSKPQPNPADAAGATQYHIFKNGTLAASVDSSVTSYTAAGLVPGETAVFRVEASDRIGNRTTGGPEVSYTVPVVTTWPADAKLTVTPGSGSSAELAWPMAFDASMAGVTQYRVTINGTPFPLVGPGEPKLTVTSLRPGTAYKIEVEAGDGTGFWAKPSLTAAYMTAGPPAACAAPIADLVDLDFSRSLTQDASPRNAAVTAGGDPILSVDPVLGRQVLRLDGAAQYLRIPHAPELNPTGQLTVMAKLSYEDLASLTADPYILAKVNTGGYGLSLGRADAVLSGATSSNQGTYRTVKTGSGLEPTVYYDVAMTFDGTTQILYINGIEAGRTSSPGVIDYHASLGKSDLLIGARTTNGSMSAVSGFFKGSLAYAKLFSQALTAEQLGCYYKATGLLAQADTPAWPLNSKLNVQQLDRSAYRLAWTPAGDAAVTQYRIYWNGRALATVGADTKEYTVTGAYPGNHRLWVEAGGANGRWSVNGPWAALADRSPDIAAEPGMMPDLLELTFNRLAGEDSGPGKHHGTAAGSAAVRYHPQLGKQALILDGSGAYVKFPAHPDLSQDYMTVAVSFLLEDKYRPQTILGKRQQSDYALEYNPVTGKLEAWFYIQDVFGAKSFTVVESRSALPIGQPVHAAATYDGVNAKLYINGEEAGSRPRSGAIGRYSEGPLTVGASSDASGQSDAYVKGAIGLVQLYSKAFDAAGVAALHSRYTAAYPPAQVASIRWDIPQTWSVGQSGQAVVNAVDANGAPTKITQGLTYQSLQPDVAAISPDGTITPLTPGTAKLVAQYGIWQAAVQVTVQGRSAQSIALKGPGQMQVGQRHSFVTTVTYDNGTDEILTSGVTFTANPAQVLAVDQFGAVTALTPGQAFVHAEWQGLSADQWVTVKPQGPGPGPEPALLSGLQFTGPASLLAGQSASTVIQAVYSDQSLRPLTGKAIYSSSHPAVAAIDSVSGAVYARSPGIVSFTAIYETTNASFTMEVKEAVEVPPALKTIGIQGPAQIKVGEKAAFALEARYETNGFGLSNPLNITEFAQWFTLNPDRLRMDGPGLMTAVAAGQSVVKAVYQGRETSFVFTVSSPTVPGGGGSGGGTGAGSGSGQGSSGASDHVPAAVPKDVYELSASEWTRQTAAGGVELADAVTQVAFSSALVNTAKTGEAVKLVHPNLKLELRSGWLQAIVGQAGLQDNSQGRVVLTFPAISASLQDSRLKAAEALEGDKLRPAAPMYEVRLTVETGKAASQEVTRWAEPIQVEFPVPRAADEALLGIYRVFDDGSMTYIGGERTKDGIRAALRDGGNYALLEYRKSYTDVPEAHWAHRTVQAMSAQHRIDGTGNGYFQPDQPITRAEFIALMVKSLRLQPAAAPGFADVPAGAWYAPHLGAAAASGLVQGRAGNRFDPQAVISREEMAVLLARAYHAAPADSLPAQAQTFADADQLAAWSQESVQFAARAGLMQGRGNGQFAPKASATRAEAAQTVQRVLAAAERLSP